VLFQVPNGTKVDAIALWDSSQGTDFEGTASWVRFKL
jgi:hypothetical protein